MQKPIAKTRVTKAKPARGQVRIIGGAWKRSVISFTANEGLRPTSDRVRETLFNWLGQDLSGLRVLDAFSGTGALALEAASRGAAKIVALESHHLAAQSIREHATRLHAENFAVLHVDAMHWLKNCNEKFDVIFLDPPFADAESAYASLAESAPQVLSEQGVVYVEAPTQFNTFGELVLRKHARAGAVRFHLFEHAQSQR